VVKLNPDGSADAAFNNGDIVTYTAAQFRSFDVNQAVVQPDGHLILQNNGQVDRIAPHGAVEQSFIEEGTYTRNSIAVQPDGKILIADAVSLDNDQVASVSRFNADGSPDMAYGDNGRAATGSS
jgi:sugar lactone lactonase YvrE